MKGKLFGLKQIDEFDLPRPRWIFLTNPSELPREPWTDAPWGWTVRCALKSKYESFSNERNLPFYNLLKWEEINNYLNYIEKTYCDDITYIIYPSWSFHSSGTVLVTKYEIIIESVFGSIAKLTDGKMDPDMILINSRYTPYRNMRRDNNMRYMFKSSINRLYRYYDIISLYESVLEWSLTVENKLYFHQWDINIVS